MQAAALYVYDSETPWGPAVIAIQTGPDPVHVLVMYDLTESEAKIELESFALKFSARDSVHDHRLIEHVGTDHAL